MFTIREAFRCLSILIFYEFAYNHLCLLLCCLYDISSHFWCQVMVPGLQAMDVDNGDGNILKVIIDENTNHFISDEMLVSEPAVHHAPEPAGVLRAWGELPGWGHHLLHRGQQGESDMWHVIGQPWHSPNAVPSQALLRRMFGENQVSKGSLQ